MKLLFSYTLVAHALLVTCLTVPADNLETTPIYPLPPALLKRKDHCDHSSFQDNTTSNAPLAADCAWLIGHLNLDHWTHDKRTELVKHKTCRFVAHGPYGNCWLGANDIEEVLAMSILKFQKEIDGHNRVAAWGRLSCRAPDSLKGTVDWSIERRYE